jgi:HSP90 family molecular chaperone
MDAVDIRLTRLNESIYKKKISICIDLKNNSLSVTDNGIGFNHSEFKSFLAPNISFKDGSKTRGHKGVGSTLHSLWF